MSSPPKPLPDCFQDGADSREAGGRQTDNPHPPGTPERAEWEAGFLATFDLDEDHDPASDRGDTDDDTPAT